MSISENEASRKPMILWLSDELVRFAVRGVAQGNVEKDTEKWRAINGLFEALLATIGSNKFEHVVQNPFNDFLELAEKVKKYGIKLDDLVLLDENMKPFVLSLFPGVAVHVLHLTRVRDLSTPSMNVVGLPLTKGDPEAIRMAISNRHSVGIFDTISFTASTAVKTADMIGASSPVFLFMGATKAAANGLEERGNVVQGFFIDERGVDAWHLFDFLQETRTSDGRTIKASELILLLKPVFEGKKSIKEFLDEMHVEINAKNPNLWLNAWPGGTVGNHIDPAKIAGNLGVVTGILHALETLTRTNSDKSAELSSLRRAELDKVKA